jgi:hypothetical protein
MIKEKNEMENEVNVNEQKTATPEVELTGTAPETPENTSVNNSFPELSAADLEKLSPVEQDLYLDAKEMNPAEIAVMPPDVRKDIENLRNKLTAPATAETATASATVDDAPKSEVEKADVTPSPAAGETATAPEVSSAVSADDTIKRLSGEVNHWKAKYNTLQGKYNAEIKNVNKATAPKEEPDAGKGDDAEEGEESSLDADIVSEIRRIARKEFASGNNTTPAVDQEMASKVNDLYSDRQRSIFDAKIRSKCGNGIGFSEVDQHPLFNSFAREMYDGNRVTADAALEEAIAKGDYEIAAGIIAEVVNVMQNNHMWDIGRHTGNAQAVPANAPQVVPASVAEPVPKSPVAQSVKPSAVVPHNVSGVTNQSLHTGRTAAQAKQEYAALHKRFLGGDSTVLPRMNQLDDEITRLEIKEKFK